MAFKMSQKSPTASLDITEVLTYTFVTPSILKAKTYNWLFNTHTHTQQLGTSHRLLMVILLAQTLLTRAKFWPLRVIKRYIFGDWLWSPQALESNEGTFHAFALVWQTAQNGRLHKTGGTYYQSCMYPTNCAWPAFLMPLLLLLPLSGHLSRGFTVSPTKACILCATPAGTYWVQSPGFPKIGCYQLNVKKNNPNFVIVEITIFILMCIISAVHRLTVFCEPVWPSGKALGW